MKWSIEMYRDKMLIAIMQYRIMQIVCGGKVSRLHNLLVIRGKTLAIVQQFETTYNK